MAERPVIIVAKHVPHGSFLAEGPYDVAVIRERVDIVKLIVKLPPKK